MSFATMQPLYLLPLYHSWPHILSSPRHWNEAHVALLWRNTYKPVRNSQHETDSFIYVMGFWKIQAVYSPGARPLAREFEAPHSCELQRHTCSLMVVSFLQTINAPYSTSAMHWILIGILVGINKTKLTTPLCWKSPDLRLCERTMWTTNRQILAEFQSNKASLTDPWWRWNSPSEFRVPQEPLIQPRRHSTALEHSHTMTWLCMSRTWS